MNVLERIWKIQKEHLEAVRCMVQNRASFAYVSHHRNNEIVEDSGNKSEVPKEMCTTSKLSLSGHAQFSVALYKHDFVSALGQSFSR